MSETRGDTTRPRTLAAPSADAASARRLERLNFRHLHHFFEVARHGSLKAAAGALDLSSATLSTQIRQLEAVVGEPLLVRESRRGVRLTEAGHAVWLHAQKIFAEGESLLETIERIGEGGPGALRIGLPTCLPGALRAVVLATLREGDDARPIDVVSAPIAALLDSLRAGRLDAAITDRPTDPADESLWNGASFYNAGIAFLGRRDDASQRDERFPDLLEGARLVLPTDAVAMRPRLDRWLREQSLTPIQVGEADDPRDQGAIAREHRALFVAPACGLRALVADGALQVVGQTQAVRVSFHLAGGERALSRNDVARWSDRLRRRAARLAMEPDDRDGVAPLAWTGKDWTDHEDSRSDAA